MSSLRKQRVDVKTVTGICNWTAQSVGNERDIKHNSVNTISPDTDFGTVRFDPVRILNETLKQYTCTCTHKVTRHANQLTNMDLAYI